MHPSLILPGVLIGSGLNRMSKPSAPAADEFTREDREGVEKNGCTVLSTHPFALFFFGIAGEGLPRHAYSISPTGHRPFERSSVWVRFANLPERDGLKLVVSSAAEVVAATTTAATTAGTREICAWGASFIDGQGTAIECLAIQPGNRPLNILAIGELHKSETPGRPCHFVADHHGGSHLKACIGYEFIQPLIGGAVG